MATQSRAAPSVFGSTAWNHLASTRRFFRSTSKSDLRPGRCTLMTTSSLFFFRRARCTCPSDAAENGSFSMLAKSSNLSPSSVLMISIDFSESNGGTLSCSFSSSWRYSFDSRSTRVENCCPTLMNVGPRRSSSARSQMASSRFLALWFSGVIPPSIFLYVPFFPILKSRKAKTTANFQISSVRCRTPYVLKRFHFPPGASATTAAASLPMATGASSPPAADLQSPRGSSDDGGGVGVGVGVGVDVGVVSGLASCSKRKFRSAAPPTM
mmetsp:Transcript_13772/g.31577  ORF Transcript_13772/g.31577 Transcript_13772/m.31577 type:complete len:268 (-) Transcript_13772:681-1484(-)